MKKSLPNPVLILALLALLMGFLFQEGFLLPRFYLVAAVTDGDTIKLEDGRVIRYLGFDAPEEEACFSQEAKEMNEKLVLGKKVQLEFDINKMDRFGRYLAYVYLPEEEISVNQFLLKEGAGEFFLDTVNLRHQDLLVQAAEEGHQAKKGLWQACAPDPKVGCQIKGNLDKLDKRWYHLPSFRHYDQVVINLKDGDHWFCTEKEALEAGFERARE